MKTLTVVQPYSQEQQDYIDLMREKLPPPLTTDLILSLAASARAEVTHYLNMRRTDRPEAAVRLTNFGSRLHNFAHEIALYDGLPRWRADELMDVARQTLEHIAALRKVSEPCKPTRGTPRG